MVAMALLLGWCLIVGVGAAVLTALYRIVDELDVQGQQARANEAALFAGIRARGLATVAMVRAQRALGGRHA